ncbi:hypothetical protein Pla8534_71130 [Lignipirellula cremea]|uniref:Uncharacterized protein n=1 Tax=Lignipirellula cremea TaxID=2528010 RepID=A0A518E539_9BACT|nr:hypothetical protein Pla8534_71130 [Lignipirellula cremea]
MAQQSELPPAQELFDQLTVATGVGAPSAVINNSESKRIVFILTCPEVKVNWGGTITMVGDSKLGTSIKAPIQGVLRR